MNRTAISAIASRSSTTAIDRSIARAPAGMDAPATASTPSAKAMSVAVGIAQAPPSAAAPPDAARAMTAGTIMPPTAAKTGRVAARRLLSSPVSSSRFSSIPATKKKIASSPSEAQCARERSSSIQSGPIARWECQKSS